jgi:hypothetical protein
LSSIKLPKVTEKTVHLIGTGYPGGAGPVDKNGSVEDINSYFSAS